MRDRTRISLLQVTTVPATLDAFLTPYARHFRNMGWRVECAATGASRSICQSDYDAIHDLRFSRNPARNNVPRLCGEITRLVKSRDYNIVHVHTPVASFITRLALRRMAGRPLVVYTVHGFHFHSCSNSLSGRIFHRLEVIAARWTDYLITINAEDFAAASNFPGIQKESVRFFPGVGIDLSAYSADRVQPSAVESFRASLGLRPSTKLFLSIGELDPRKRQEDAIRALSLLGREDVSLAIAGDGPLRGRLESLARRLGVAGRVHLLGFRRDVPVLLRASCALVFPSAREGLSRSVMEAMALGVPVLGSDARGVNDLLDEGAGFIFPVGDIQRLGALMGALAKDAELGDDVVRAAREKVRRFGLEGVLRLQEELYLEGLTQKRHSSRPLLDAETAGAT